MSAPPMQQTLEYMVLLPVVTAALALLLPAPNRPTTGQVQ
jgi:hypothetical protein